MLKLGQLRLVYILFSIFVSLIEISAIEYKQLEKLTLGHSRNINGELTWGDPPTKNYHGNDQDADVGAWMTTVNFAKSLVLSSTRAQSFPYDLIRRILRNEYSQEEISDYESNIIISCSVGGLFIFSIIISFIVYVIYKRFRRRRTKYTGQKPLFTGQTLNIFLVFGVLTVLVNFMFIICIMVVNVNIDGGLNQLDKRLYNSMEDVKNYFDQTHKQYDYMTEQSNLWFGQEVLEQDINTLGQLIWQPGSQKFYPTLSPIFKDLKDVDQYTTNAVSTLKILNKKITDVTNGVGLQLKTNFSAAFYNLTFARNDWTCIGCSGSCQGCQDIVPVDIYPVADFLALPNLTNWLINLIVITMEPIQGSLRSPGFFYVDGISAIIHERLQSNITDMRSRVKDFMEIVNSSTADLKFPSEKKFYFNKLRPKFNNFHDRIKTGNNFRSGFTWFFTVANICLVVILLAVLLFIILNNYKHCHMLIIHQDDKFLLPRRVLIMSCIACITLCVGHLGLAIGGFYIGANLERVVCQTSRNYTIVEKVLDVPNTIPDHPGYFFGSTILGNGSLELQLSNILRQCKNNLPAYDVLQQKEIAPALKNQLNIENQFGDINDVFDDMYFDLVNVSLVPPLLETWIQSFKESTIFDVNPFLDLFNKTIITADLDTFISNLRHVANISFADGGPMNPSKDKLIQAANFLSGIKPLFLELADTKAYIEQLYYEFQGNVTVVKNKLETAVNKLMIIDDHFWNQSSLLIKQGVDEFRSDFMKVLPEFTDISSKWLKENIGMCKPLTDAYDSVVYGFCNKFSDFENAEWLLCGLDTVCLLIMAVMIIAIHNSIIVDTTHTDDINANFEKVFGNIKIQSKEGLIDKAMYRVKNSVPTRPYRGRSSITPMILTTTTQQ